MAEIDRSKWILNLHGTVDRSKWIVNLQGKDYATWPFVLDEAHRRGLKRLECELVQIPAAENGSVAIVKATAEFAKPAGDNPFVDCLFSAYGDASLGNVNHKMVGAIIRLAETRAKGRCLRDACNIGMTLVEELPDDDDEAPAVRREAAPNAGNDKGERCRFDLNTS